MKPIPSDKTTRSTPDREPPPRDRDDARDHDNARDRDPRDRDPRDREWRIGATQMAAPSTRRWRRAGRFEPAS
jgi:hypothetical protein